MKIAICLQQNLLEHDLKRITALSNCISIDLSGRAPRRGGVGPLLKRGAGLLLLIPGQSSGSFCVWPLLQSGCCVDPSEVSEEPHAWAGGGAWRALGLLAELNCGQGYKTSPNNCLRYKMLFLILRRHLLK